MADLDAPHYHLALATEFIAAHFTDPQITIADAAAYAGVHPRTLTRSLAVCETSWQALIEPRRLERGLQLLETEKYPISDIARLSGYRSPSAFARMVRRHTRMSPAEYRRGKTGVKRAGGATGAFARRRKRPSRPGVRAGQDAVMHQETLEAQARIEDRRTLERGPTGASIAEIADEWMSPRRMRDEPAYWRTQRREFEAWVEEHDVRAASDEHDDAGQRWQN